MIRYCKCMNHACRHPSCDKKLRVSGLEWQDEDTGDIHTSAYCEHGTGYTIGDVRLKQLKLIPKKTEDASKLPEQDGASETSNPKGSATKRKRKQTAKRVAGSLRQEDVARDFGVSRQTVNEWEKNETENGPGNKSNPYGYYKALRLDKNLRGAYDELVSRVKIFFRAKAEAEAKGTRFRWTFVQFNEKYAKHNVKT